jgi:hypothetical protein
MTTQRSFSRIEKDLLPAFRQHVSSAESTEDVKKFFVHTALELFDKAANGQLNLEYEDVALDPENESQAFLLSEVLTGNTVFTAVWHDSDLANILRRFAVTAVNRYKHLAKNLEKTEAKIRMV